MSDQSFEAQCFIAEHRSSVQSCCDMLTNYATQFMSSYGSQCMPSGVLEQLNDLLRNKNLSQFQLLLRQNVPPSAEQSVRAKYWSVNDGISAYMDAIGSHWKYMTHSGRVNRLEHAHEHMSEYDLY